MKKKYIKKHNIKDIKNNIKILKSSLKNIKKNINFNELLDLDQKNRKIIRKKVLEQKKYLKNKINLYTRNLKKLQKKFLN